MNYSHSEIMDRIEGAGFWAETFGKMGWKRHPMGWTYAQTEGESGSSTILTLTYTGNQYHLTIATFPPPNYLMQEETHMCRTIDQAWAAVVAWRLTHTGV